MPASYFYLQAGRGSELPPHPDGHQRN